MSINEIEQIQEEAQRGSVIGPQLILRLTAYLREVLRTKAIAEAIAYEAAKETGIKSWYAVVRQSV